MIVNEAKYIFYLPDNWKQTSERMRLEIYWSRRNIIKKKKEDKNKKSTYPKMPPYEHLLDVEHQAHEEQWSNRVNPHIKWVEFHKK